VEIRISVDQISGKPIYRSVSISK